MTTCSVCPWCIGDVPPKTRGEDRQFCSMSTPLARELPQARELIPNGWPHSVRGLSEAGVESTRPSPYGTRHERPGPETCPRVADALGRLPSQAARRGARVIKHKRRDPRKEHIKELAARLEPDEEIPVPSGGSSP